MDHESDTPTFGLHPELSRESWALVWLPAFAAEALYAREAIEQGCWGILWKKRGKPHFHWYPPLTSSEDAAMSRIQTALTVSPTFVKRHEGGDFYAIPVRFCLRVPGKAPRKEPRNLLVEFGLSRNLETALAQVEGAVKHGTAFPAKTATWWRQTLGGGVVVPVPVHKRVVVSEARQRAEEAIL